MVSESHLSFKTKLIEWVRVNLIEILKIVTQKYTFFSEYINIFYFIFKKTSFIATTPI